MAALQTATRPFQPTRLRLARKLRSLSQKELARATDVSAAAISQFESGAAAPSGETVERLALALACTPEFFYRAPSGDDSTGAFFRSLRRAPKAEQERARAYAVLIGEVVRLLDAYVELPQVAMPALHLSPGASGDEVEVAAARLRSEWELPSGPVPNVVHALEAHGATVVAVGAFHPMLDAFSLWAGNRPVVVLCSDKGVPKRRRFDAAHELGHLVLHDRARSGDAALERQAHRFAAAFLMPGAEVMPFLPRRAADIERVRDMSNVWGVSMAAVLYRARVLGTLSETSYTRAVRRMSALGWRTDEPVESGPEEVPTVLSSASAALPAAGGSLRAIASDIGFPYQRLCRMIAVPEERDDAPAEVIHLRAAG